MAELSETAPGVARLTWTPQLQSSGLRPAADEVRRAVDSAFADGYHRVETLVDPADQAAQRIATFSGLMREGIARGIDSGQDRIVYARLVDDVPLEDPAGFRSLLNSFLPRKRAIGQMLIRAAPDEEGGADRVLLCQLTYKRDYDLPGGVVEVGESPREATAREVTEELGLEVPAGRLLLTDWLPPWGGWDDAVCLVFDGGVHDPGIIDSVVRQEREIRSAGFHTLDEVSALAADFTTRRIAAALAGLARSGPEYTESGR
ncbi:NUDIX hydrolase [Nocardioides terrisoli]|uniref:NUDIX hydrolase n=1 Tax=Nocardioides terrisoli TaxID=3388267 RepID=UPI00287BB8B3|nr:NUDIX hydrolase [Nocardioides marmorisolisilvae]